MTFLVAARFLPLFPLNIVFNLLLDRLHPPLLRGLLLLLWPQLGVWLLEEAAQPVPAAIVYWAVLTSAAYALRLLTVRDLRRWAAFLAASGHALAWALAATRPSGGLQLFIFCFSLPPALLVWVGELIRRRLGATHAALTSGLGSRLPFLATLLVLTALAAVATPPFPGFFALLGLLNALSLALAVLAIWLLWAWSLAALLQGFVFGEAPTGAVADIGRATFLSYLGALVAFTAAGLHFMGKGL